MSDLLKKESKPIDLLADDDIPYALVALPSKGLIYAPDHPLHKCESVEIKAMGTHEEEILASPALIQQGTVLNWLMKSCLVNKLIDPASLLIGDKAAILMAIRVSGFGSKYKLELKCAKCGTSYKEDFDLRNNEIKRIGATPLVEGQNLFEFILPVSKKRVRFSLPIDKDDLEVLKMNEARKKNIKSAAVDRSISDRLGLAIKSINGVEDREQISRFIQTKMTSMDSRALRSHISKIEPDIILKQSVSCPACGQSEEVSPSFGWDFFWPKLDELEFDPG